MWPWHSSQIVGRHSPELCLSEKLNEAEDQLLLLPTLTRSHVEQTSPTISLSTVSLPTISFIRFESNSNADPMF